MESDDERKAFEDYIAISLFQKIRKETEAW